MHDRVYTIDLQSILSIIWEAMLNALEICRSHIIISYGTFNLSLFDVMIGLLAISLAFALFFPWVDSDSDE